MSDKKRLFGTFGVRRVANEVLTPEFASRLAACYGSVVQGTVAVGGDTRTSSPMLMEAVKAGLLSSGCDVVDDKKRNKITQTDTPPSCWKESTAGTLYLD